MMILFFLSQCSAHVHQRGLSRHGRHEGELRGRLQELQQADGGGRQEAHRLKVLSHAGEKVYAGNCPNEELSLNDSVELKSSIMKMSK